MPLHSVTPRGTIADPARIPAPKTVPVEPGPAQIVICQCAVARRVVAP
jgi:hypothetical protein